MFNPELKDKQTLDGGNYPVFLKPAKKLSVQDLKNALRSHYDGKPYDNYSSKDENQKTSTAP